MAQGLDLAHLKRLDQRKVDPILKQKLMWWAFQTIAEIVHGIDPEDKDAVIQWCLNVGYLKPHPSTHGLVVLTQKGGLVMWAFCNAVQEGVAMKRAATGAVRKGDDEEGEE